MKKIHISKIARASFLIIVMFGLFSLDAVSATSEGLNITAEKTSNWYFGYINELKISIYNEEYNIDVDDIEFDYYNNSDVSINQLGKEKIESGIYIQKFLIYNINDIKEKDIVIKVTATKENQTIEKYIDVSIYKADIIRRAYFGVRTFFHKIAVEFEERSSREHNYTLYIVLGIIIVILILLIIVISYSGSTLKKKR